ncbi:MAG: hypothetical protein IJ334_12130, partial [Clostridia bacterium]|nr:hypothetical protein [Clostridia bacterium]
IFGKKDKEKKNEKDTPLTPAAESTKAPETNAAPKAPEFTAAEAPAVQDAPAKPKYQTPEGFDFNRYFLAERRVVLENVSYEIQRPANATGQFKLGVKDTIVAQVMGQAGVKATYNRTLRFDPEGPFVLSVSLGVMLVFNPGTRDEIDWKTIDVAEEFKKNCPQLIQQMTAKATLLVAEITNMNGNPIIPLR